MRYSRSVKRILLLALLILTGHVAHAQSFGVTLGARLEVVPNTLRSSSEPAALPALGFELGAFVRSTDLSIGVRLTISSFALLFWHGQADVYVGYTLLEGTTLYAGAGYGFNVNLFAGGTEDVHGLLGVRFASGIFIEATPGISYFRVCTSRPPQSNDCSTYEEARVPILGLSFGWVWVIG